MGGQGEALVLASASRISDPATVKWGEAPMEPGLPVRSRLALRCRSEDATPQEHGGSGPIASRDPGDPSYGGLRPAVTRGCTIIASRHSGRSDAKINCAWAAVGARAAARAGRNPDSATGSPRGSGVARPDSPGHAAGAGRRAPRRSTGAIPAWDGDGRASGKRDNVGVADAVRFRASIASRVEVTRYPMCRRCAQDESGLVRRTAPRQASPTGEPSDAESLTVTTAVVVKGDDVEGGAATSMPSY